MVSWLFFCCCFLLIFLSLQLQESQFYVFFQDVYKQNSSNDKILQMTKSCCTIELRTGFHTCHFFSFVHPNLYIFNFVSRHVLSTKVLIFPLIFPFLGCDTSCKVEIWYTGALRIKVSYNWVLVLSCLFFT